MKGQNIMESVLILVVVLAAILSAGFIGRMRGAMSNYLDKASTTIVELRPVGG